MLSAANHKTLGLYYILLSIVFGTSGSLFSFLMRIELATSGFRIISSENQNFYNFSITLHGLLMIFYTVMPGLYGGFGNYFLPFYIGTNEVAFPRVNCLSLLLLPLSAIIVFVTVIAEFGAGTGWTFYPPLSTSLMALSPVSIDQMIAALAIVGFSSLLSSLNFITTTWFLGFCMNDKANAVFVYAILFTAVMLICTLPILTAGLVMIVLDLHLNTHFYDPFFNGDPVLYQHLFWFFGHPEVYIIILPGFGVISQILATSVSKQIFGSNSMILAMGCISILGALVWAHHMMTVGLEVDTRAYFSAATTMIAIPTGTKIFNWLSTYMGNYVYATNIEVMYVLFFILLFTLGGTTGVILGNTALDIALHDTYYVVAHFHFVLSLGAIISLIAAIIFYQEYIIGYGFLTLKLNNSILIRVWSIVFICSILLTFLPMHLLGFNVMPRRIPDYPDYITYINNMCSLGSLSTLITILLLLL
uniref:Cytochrome c oxidase subunit 1 n=1 Tax=Goussia bayae TaxID=2303416 RepID=A0A481WFW6_9EIME|nr:cytochrome oxidase subunit 1 [Goussia bayae]